MQTKSSETPQALEPAACGDSSRPLLPSLRGTLVASLMGSLALALLVPGPAEAQSPAQRAMERAQAEAEAEEEDEAEGEGEGEETVIGSERQKPPVAPSNTTVSIDFVDTPLTDVVKFMAEITGRNFIMTDELKGEVTIISHQPVTVSEAYEAFLSALQMAGYTTVTVGKATKVVSTGEAANNPLRVYEGGSIPYTDNYVTQIIQLENVSVSDVSSVVKDLSGTGAKIIAYAPTNTLIITDSATNIRRVYKIVQQLDVASPKAKLQIYPLKHATASDVKDLIDELFGTEESSSSASSSSSSRSSRRNRRRSRSRDNESDSASSSATSVGKEGKFIQKTIADDRTNSLIFLANEEAMAEVIAFIQQIDIDVDPASRAQIHVVYLEHAKAEDVAQVLSQLSDGGSSSSSSSRSNSRSSSRRGGPAALRNARGGDGPENDSNTPSAAAAFDDGIRITSDENTNSLVIIATPDQFEIVKSVISKLDIRRKQVFVEAVVMELATDDSNEFGIGFHGGTATDEGGLSIASAQLNGSSLGLSTDVLTGMALGVYGKALEVPITGADGSQTTLSVPAFGVAMNAIQSNSSVNILSTPNILTLDNEEAKIVVGRNIPFPVSTGRDNNNNPIISYQREDVAITLKVTPQINESDYVTMEVFQEVQEIEEDSSGLDVNSAGFITSKRQAETTVLVRDNQTVVIGGLISETDTEVETKIPILGDIPLIGALFRGQRKSSRKSNLLIFLTPHVIDEPADLEEVYRIKWAQREEFIRRFYGKSRDQQEAELASLLSYSMNQIDQPSRYRGPSASDADRNFQVIGGEDEPDAVLVEPIVIEADDEAVEELIEDAVEDAVEEVLEEEDDLDALPDDP